MVPTSKGTGVRKGTWERREGGEGKGGEGKGQWQGGSCFKILRGIDAPAHRVLSQLKEEICYPVAMIMRASMETGVVPVPDD